MKVLAAPYQGARELRHAHVEVRGQVLSHLIGISFFVSLILERVVSFDFMYTSFTQIPIRLVAIWLLLDRVGRYRRVQINLWDYIHLTFIGLFAFALVWADVNMTRDSGLINFLTWVSSNFNNYLFFLVVREGLTRRGFKPEILLRWMLFTFAVYCSIALMQALDPAGIRNTIDNFYHQRQAEAKMEGPSAPWQARGPAVHANSLAVMIVIGLSVLVGLWSYRKLRPVDWGIGVLMMATLFATYSRTGMASMALVTGAFIMMLFAQRKYQAGTMALFVGGCLLMLFAASVYAFDIKRYKVLVEGEGPIRNKYETGISGWYLRQSTIGRALDVAEKYPLTGVSIATSAINQERVIIKNEYAFEGLLLNNYIFAWVSYGLMGVGFVFGILAVTLAQFGKVRSRYALAPAMFIAGVGLLVTGIAENSTFTPQTMIVVNILAALAAGNLLKPDAEVKAPKMRIE